MDHDEDGFTRPCPECCFFCRTACINPVQLADASVMICCHAAPSSRAGFLSLLFMAFWQAASVMCRGFCWFRNRPSQVKYSSISRYGWEAPNLKVVHLWEFWILWFMAIRSDSVFQSKTEPFILVTILYQLPDQGNHHPGNPDLSDFMRLPDTQTTIFRSKRPGRLAGIDKQDIHRH